MKLIVMKKTKHFIYAIYYAFNNLFNMHFGYMQK